jgi:GNAT superfamily N-acetyltransferase
MKVTIDKPTYDDVETLWKWGEENWELWGDEKGRWFSKDSLRKWLDDPEDDVLLVAREGGKLIGMSMTVTIRNWGYCAGLYVDEKYRGQGVGKKLMLETRNQLSILGVGTLILLVDVKNKRATKFYLREGFRQGFGFYMMIADLKEKDA